MTKKKEKKERKSFVGNLLPYLRRPQLLYTTLVHGICLYLENYFSNHLTQLMHFNSPNS